MNPLMWILLGGGALYLLSPSSRADKPKPDFVTAEIMGGTDGDEYTMIVDSITQRVSPFDEDSVVVYHNNSYDATSKELVEDLNMSAKESGIKAVAHVFGPAGKGFPYFRHYSRGALKSEPSVSSWDEAVEKISMLEVKPAAGAMHGRKVIVQSGRQVMIAPKVGRHGKASRTRASRHMKGMMR